MKKLVEEREGEILGAIKLTGLRKPFVFSHI
jgi:hypothetical protein